MGGARARRGGQARGRRIHSAFTLGASANVDGRERRTRTALDSRKTRRSCLSGGSRSICDHFHHAADPSAFSAVSRSAVAVRPSAACHIYFKRKDKTAFGTRAKSKTKTKSDCKAAKTRPTQTRALPLCKKHCGQSMAGSDITQPAFSRSDGDNRDESFPARPCTSTPAVLLPSTPAPSLVLTSTPHPPPRCFRRSVPPHRRECRERYRDRSGEGARERPSTGRCCRQPL